MMNRRPQYRVHIPNSLAIFAAVLLIISAVAGLETHQDANFSAEKTAISAKAGNAGDDSVNKATKIKSRGLNLGLLLFRRG